MNTDNLQILNEKYKQDFNTALYIYENSYTHQNLIDLLKNGSIVEKQIAALKLHSIDNFEEAQILISNLTGCDGKIREAVSFRLKEFIPQNTQFYKKFADIFLDAIIDINGNICRNTIEAIQNMKNISEFTNYFCPELIANAQKLTAKIKTFNIQDGKYKINKEIFKLYWYLETIYHFIDFIPPEKLKPVLQETKNISEYTIREKTAKILSKIHDNKDLLQIKQELKQDENYYVRRF